MFERKKRPRAARFVPMLQNFWPCNTCTHTNTHTHTHSNTQMCVMYVVFIVFATCAFRDSAASAASCKLLKCQMANSLSQEGEVAVGVAVDVAAGVGR